MNDVQEKINHLTKEVDLLRKQQRYDLAIDANIRVCNLIEQNVGKNHPEYAKSLRELSSLYLDKGEYSTAESLYKQALEIARNTLGEKNPEYVSILNDLCLCYFRTGKYSKAEPLCKQSFEIARKILGEDHQQYAKSLNNLGSLYYYTFEDSKAEPLLKQAVEIRHKILGENHPEYGASLNNLALLFRDTGRYSEAEPLYKQALEIARNTLGENDLEYAIKLNNLSLLYRDMGEYSKAEPLLKQAVEIRHKILGENHPEYFDSIHNLCSLYLGMRLLTKAKPLYKLALEIALKIFGKNHPKYAIILNELGLVYYYAFDDLKARSLYKQALKIKRKIGENDSYYANILNNLALLFRDTGRYSEAEPLYKQALEIKRKIGENNLDYALSLTNLGFYYSDIGEYSKAEPLLKQAVEIARKILRADHPEYVHFLYEMGMLYLKTNRPQLALPLLGKAIAIVNKMIRMIFSISSEKQRMSYLTTIMSRYTSFINVILQNFSNDKEMVARALDLVLKRKGIVTEAMAAQRNTILENKYPHLKEKMKSLNLLRMQVGQKMLSGPGFEGRKEHEKRISQWNNEIERLESELANELPESNISRILETIDHSTILSSLPPASALIEFVQLKISDFKKSKKNETPHYIAFILSSSNPHHVEMIDLGKARLIDNLVFSYRRSITSSFSNEYIDGIKKSSLELIFKIGNLLRKIVWDPLVPYCENNKKIFVSPDGDLTKIPFEILPIDNKKYLVDEYHFSYLTTARDILRYQILSKETPTKPLVIADPDFDFAIKTPKFNKSESANGMQSRDLDPSNIRFDSLMGTHKEGILIADLLGVQPWLQKEVLEARLKACKSPKILHIASHGFFLDDQKSNDSPDYYDVSRGLSIEKDRITKRYMKENPLLRSGLAMAGANHWNNSHLLPHEAEDGLLTAVDVTGLDLSATELVVLSACETGLGKVHIGEGVFGLRRAFVLAGAKSLVMSLWKVPDKETQELMVEFYQQILDGQPRSEALRNAMLKMKEKNPNPYFWGAFICQGATGPIQFN